jgi:uncharacterized protein (DUF488 family)
MEPNEKMMYTVGYQGRTPEQFLEVLMREGITLVVDVRERPYSRQAGFNKNALAERLAAAGIAYEGMGKQLGGFTCTREMWEKGCLRLAKIAREQTVALMCMERKPNRCHRRHIAAILAEGHGFTIRHV